MNFPLNCVGFSHRGALSHRNFGQSRVAGLWQEGESGSIITKKSTISCWLLHFLGICLSTKGETNWWKIIFLPLDVYTPCTPAVGSNLDRWSWIGGIAPWMVNSLPRWFLVHTWYNNVRPAQFRYDASISFVCGAVRRCVYFLLVESCTATIDSTNRYLYDLVLSISYHCRFQL